MGKVIAVTSGKGGVGKSTVSLGLATAYDDGKNRILLIDTDEGLRCLDILTGLDSKITFDLGDLLNGTPEENVLYKVPNTNGIYLIPAPGTLGSINAEKFKEYILNAINKFDYIVVDFPAGIDFSLYSALPKSAFFLTVCNPDPVSVRDAYSVYENLYKINRKSRLVINKFDKQYILSGLYKNIDDIIDISGTRLIGVVPDDISVVVSAAEGKLLKKGRVYKAFCRIASRINGQNIKLPNLKRI